MPGGLPWLPRCRCYSRAHSAPNAPSVNTKCLRVARTPSGHQHIVMLPPHPLCATLRYGSSDGGHTVHNSNATLNERMKEAAARLNLAEHVAGLPGPGTVPQRLHHAVDVEAHVGRDNRWRCGVVVALWLQMDVASPSHTYIHTGTWHTGSTFWTQLVSFPLSIQMRHRTCPTFEDRLARDTRTVLCRQLPSHNFPLAPLSQRSIFFRLLRSDFVRSWQEPLSADALSRFSTADPDAHGNTLCKQATPAATRSPLTDAILHTSSTRRACASCYETARASGCAPHRS